MGTSPRRLAAVMATALACSLTLSGCQGVFDLPLPGGAARGSDVYRVTVEFRDVLDLVPQSAVKVNDVTVGAVEKVSLDGWHAQVRVRLKNSVRLPDNAVAELRQTSLLGEKFVSLEVPSGRQSSGRLGDGDVIPLDRSGRNPEVEEVLGALSLVLNGGGVAQLRTINVELTKALEGREPEVKRVIKNLDTFLGELDEHKSEIVRAIDGLDRLSARLADQRQDIGAAIEDLGPGLTVLADQREELTSMLTALSDLGQVGTRVIRRTKAETVANLEALAPTLTRLAEAGANLPNALEILFTYPFPQAATDAVKGDYTNLRITADIDLRNILANQGDPGLPNPGQPLPTGLPTVPTVPGVPGGARSGLPTALPTSLPSLPTDLPTSPGTRGGGGSGTCVAGICVGAPASSSGAYDMNLASLMTGGYS